MATIAVSSAPIFLSTPNIDSPPPLPSSPQRRRAREMERARAAASSRRKRPNPLNKPKQSKSRDGCVTCKAKRLKCDETKPSCLQCHKRGVPCGGYEKVLKWRPSPYEEINISHPQRRQRPLTEPQEVRPATSPTASGSSSTSPVATPDAGSTSSQESYSQIQETQDRYDFAPGNSYSDSSFASYPPTFHEPSPMENSFRPRQPSEAGSATSLLNSMFEDITMAPSSSPRPYFPGQSPRLIDLLLPGPELDSRTPDQDFMQDLAETNEHFGASEDVEDIQRQPYFQEDDDSWNTGLFLRQFPHTNYQHNFFAPLYLQPESPAGSPEMLMLRFDRQTCGILSIKDGPNENPWRTLIWPLAQDSPALYHAIASMTAFHTSKREPNLRFNGVQHQDHSIHLLNHEISSMPPETALATTLALAFSDSWDQQISTGYRHLRGAKALVKEVLTQHNRKALAGEDLARLKFLCNTFIYMDVIARLTSVDADESNDFEFLISPLPTPFGSLASLEVDPLMGCASTLFPLIGRAANLCRRARRSESNGAFIVSQARDLKEQIEQWETVGTSFERPEDPSAEVQDALQTAEAYRYATLLYLHQAFPEIPSPTSKHLAKKVLAYLATVKPSSRLVIVQIYPLLAAGCEIIEPEDRQWVIGRWENMSARMLIGNIDRAWEVMMEVWQRRDNYVARREATKRGKENVRSRPSIMAPPHACDISKEMSEASNYQDMLNSQSGMGSLRRENPPHQGISELCINSESRMAYPPPSSGHLRRTSDQPITELLDVEYTVRGQLHWVGVMKDWGWEVFVG